MGDLSPHFSLREFASRDGAPTPPIPCALLCVLEAIRGIANWPVVIKSGHRSPSVNDAVGGAPNSFHLRAMAADIPPGLVKLADARRAGAGGCGLTKDGWVVHVDVGPVRTWVYD